MIPNIKAYLFGGWSPVHYFDSLGMLGGQLLKTPLDPFKKGGIRFFNSITLRSGRGLPQLDALGSLLRRNDEQKGKVRQRFTHGKLGDGLHKIKRELPSMPLVGVGGIKKTVAQDKFAGLKSGTNDFTHELGAAGIHEQKLSLRSHEMVL